MRVDDKHAIFADDETGIIRRRIVRDERIDAWRQLLRFKRGAFRLEWWCGVV
jgi:hypothetical protein